jgi:hypothetical protein
MSKKERLSASVDAEVLAAAQDAVKAGRAPNLSTWVNDALHRQAEHDQRMQALDRFLEAYEEAHGVIGEADMRAAERRMATGSLRRASRRQSTGARRRGAA